MYTDNVSICDVKKHKELFEYEMTEILLKLKGEFATFSGKGIIGAEPAITDERIRLEEEVIIPSIEISDFLTEFYIQYPDNEYCFPAVAKIAPLELRLPKQPPQVDLTDIKTIPIQKIIPDCIFPSVGALLSSQATVPKLPEIKFAQMLKSIPLISLSEITADIVTMRVCDITPIDFGFKNMDTMVVPEMSLPSVSYSVDFESQKYDAITLPEVENMKEYHSVAFDLKSERLLQIRGQFPETEPKISQIIAHQIFIEQFSVEFPPLVFPLETKRVEIKEQAVFMEIPGLNIPYLPNIQL